MTTYLPAPTPQSDAYSRPTGQRMHREFHLGAALRVDRHLVCSRSTASRVGAHGEDASREATIAGLREALVGLIAEFGALTN
jgi:hypothetical protein